MLTITKTISLIILSLSQTACLFSSPMHWDKKRMEASSNQTVVMAVTHVKLGKNARENKAFWQCTHQVLDSLTQHQGYLGHKVRRSLSGREAWTLTLWQDEAALRQFVKSTVHDEAARQGFLAVSAARSFHISTTQASMQTDWQAIAALMDAHGRPMY